MVSEDHGTAPTLEALRQAREAQDSALRWMRRLGPALAIAVTLSVLRTEPGIGPSGQGLFIALALAGFALGAYGSLAAERGSWLHTASAVLLVTGAVSLVWAQSGRTGFFALVTALVVLVRKMPTRLAVALSTVTMSILVLAAMTSSHLSPLSALLVVSAIGGYCLITLLAARLRQANLKAEQLLTELEGTRAAQARAAALAERQHLAREMHDVLAHSLSGLMLQLEGARLLAASNPNDPRLPGALERAHQLGKTGLDEARHAIGMLRDDELPGPDRLPDLTRRFEEDRGVPCRLTVDGSASELGTEARLALYRVAQEALTNIAKHAEAERVEVSLDYRPEAVVLTVEDFAAVPVRSDAAPDDVAGSGSSSSSGPSSSTGSGSGSGSEGYGLAGMRERAELLGGTLTAGATESGFRVLLEVPA